MNDTISFPGKIEALDAMIDWVHEHSMSLPFSDEQRREIEVALEEVLVNIMMHAYKKQAGSIELTCQIEPGKRITFIVKDQGFPFNPLLQAPRPKSDSPLEQREEGGLGIFFMREYMDQLAYERTPSHNILSLSKSINN